MHLKSSKGFVPIYNTFGPQEAPTNHLCDISQKSAFMLESGELLFTNKKSPRCPEGYLGLSIFLKPELHFIENLKFWWENNKNSIKFIKDFEIEILIKLKDKAHNFGVPTTQVCEMAWDF